MFLRFELSAWLLSLNKPAPAKRRKGWLSEIRGRDLKAVLNDIHQLSGAAIPPPYPSDSSQPIRGGEATQPSEGSSSPTSPSPFSKRPGPHEDRDQ